MRGKAARSTYRTNLFLPCRGPKGPLKRRSIKFNKALTSFAPSAHDTVVRCAPRVLPLAPVLFLLPHRCGKTRGSLTQTRRLPQAGPTLPSETSIAHTHPPPPSAHASNLSFASPRSIAAESTAGREPATTTAAPGRAGSVAGSAAPSARTGAHSHRGGHVPPGAESSGFRGSATHKGPATSATTAVGPGGFKKRRTPPLVIEPSPELEARLREVFVAYAMHGSRPNSVYISFPKFFRLLLDSGALVRLQRERRPQLACSPAACLFAVYAMRPALTRPLPPPTSSCKAPSSGWSRTSSREYKGCEGGAPRGTSSLSSPCQHAVYNPKHARSPAGSGDLIDRLPAPAQGRKVHPFGSDDGIAFWCVIGRQHG